MLSNFKVYFRVVRRTKSPLVFLMDSHYEALGIEQWLELWEGFNQDFIPYLPDFYDCDNYAFDFRSYCSRQLHNGVGVVYGKRHGPHMWNILLTSQGARYIEPQTGQIDPAGYIGLVTLL